jgi:hypothetical protein
VNAATDKIWPLNLAEQQNVKLNKRKRKKNHREARIKVAFATDFVIDYSWIILGVRTPATKHPPHWRQCKLSRDHIRQFSVSPETTNLDGTFFE